MQGSTIRPSLYTHVALHARIATASTVALAAALASFALLNGVGRRRLLRRSGLRPRR